MKNTIETEIFIVFQTMDSVEVAAETRTGDNQVGNERLNLTVYF